MFYDNAGDCRNLSATLIRASLPLLRTSSAAGKDVRTLVEFVRTEEQDQVVEASWQTAIDALRALCRTSPKGTQRERQTLLNVARDPNLVRAMTAAAASESDIDPSWLAVFNAAGSPASVALVRSQLAGFAHYPDLALAIASFDGALRAEPRSPSPLATRSSSRSRPIPVSGGTFTSARFWALIDKASNTADPVGTLGQWLRDMTPSQIAAFDRHFAAAMKRAYRHDLWGAAYLLLGGCSDDSFTDFRADLILRGKRAFERVLKVPDALADHTDVQGIESMAALAAGIYKEKTGRDLPSASTTSVPPVPGGSTFDFDDKVEIRRRYPRLSARLRLARGGGR